MGARRQLLSSRLQLGYFTEARFHHYYTGSLGELREFTLDFVAGEIRYFSELPAASDNLLEPPAEWLCQETDRDTARSILEIAVKSLWPPPRRFARSFSIFNRQDSTLDRSGDFW